MIIAETSSGALLVISFCLFFRRRHRRLSQNILPVYFCHFFLMIIELDLATAGSRASSVGFKQCRGTFVGFDKSSLEPSTRAPLGLWKWSRARDGPDEDFSFFFLLLGLTALGTPNRCYTIANTPADIFSSCNF